MYARVSLECLHMFTRNERKPSGKRVISSALNKISNEIYLIFLCSNCIPASPIHIILTLSVAQFYHCVQKSS